MFLKLRNHPICRESSIRHYGNKHFEKKSYRLKELEFKFWKENIQLTDTKYAKWQESFDETISNLKFNEDVVEFIKQLHTKTEEPLSKEINNRIEQYISKNITPKYMEKLQQWMKIHCTKYNLFVENERLDWKKLISAFIEPTFYVSIFASQQDASVRTQLLKSIENNYSYLPHRVLGKQVLKTLLATVLNSGVRHSADSSLPLLEANQKETTTPKEESASNLLAIVEPTYDVQVKDMTPFDLIDYVQYTMENIEKAQNSLLSEHLIQKISKKLNLRDLLLMNLEIEERKEGEEVEIGENDPIYSIKEKSKLQLANPKELYLFETNKEAALESYMKTLDVDLFYSLIGIVYSYATQRNLEPQMYAFIKSEILDLLVEENAQETVKNSLQIVSENFDYYVKKLDEFLFEKYQTSVDYRLDTTIVKNRTHRQVKVNAYINGHRFGYAFGESYLQAKCFVAKELYDEFSKNTIRLEQKQHLFQNSDYIQNVKRVLRKPSATDFKAKEFAKQYLAEKSTYMDGFHRDKFKNKRT